MRGNLVILAKRKDSEVKKSRFHLPRATDCLCFSRMQPETRGSARSLSTRANDLQARDLASRVSRFARARLRSLCIAGMQLADDPRVLRAWRRKWDSDHYLRLTRWHDEGFTPRVVYDIGAHEGLWAQMCQDIFAPARLLLFEPQASMHSVARARQPAGAAWEIVPVALGEHEETHVLHVTQNSAASSLLTPLEGDRSITTDTHAVGEQKVQVMPLDRLVQARQLPPPDLVKIDVQGFEGRVLSGGEKTLAQAQRLVVEVSLREMYEGQSLLPEILSRLTALGFEQDDMNETFRCWPGWLWQVDLWMRRGS